MPEVLRALLKSIRGEAVVDEDAEPAVYEP